MNEAVFRGFRGVKALVCIAVLCVASALCAPAAQAEGSTGGSIAGLVCDAVTSRTLPGATVEVAARGSDRVIRTTTDRRGVFNVSGLPSALYIVEVSKEGYHPGRAVADLRESHAARLIIKLEPREIQFGVVEGVVRDAGTGGPIANAIVSYSRTTSGEILTARTNERGAYRLAGIPAGIQPLRANHREYFPKDKRVEVPAGGAAVLNFHLERRPPPRTGVIEGLVKNRATGDPIEGAIVAVEGVLTRALILTDERGLFRVEGVPAGDREVVVMKRGFITQGRVVEVPAGGAVFVRFHLVPITQPERGSLFGVVTDAETGDPIAGAVVRLIPPDDREYLSARTEDSQPYVVTDRRGFYAFPGLPVGTYGVKVAKRGYEPQVKRAVIEANQRTELNFELEKIIVPVYGALFGQLTDAETRDPIARALVMLGGGLNDAERLTDRANTETTTNERGIYLFRRLRPGEYIVYVYARGYRPARAKAEVTAGGETRLDFELKPIQPPDLGAIVGQVRDARTSDTLENAIVIVPLCNPTRACDRRNVLWARTDARGNYRIDGVPPGLRNVIAFKRGYHEGEDTVVVRPGQTVRVDFALKRRPVRPGNVRVRILSALTGRPIPGARIRLAISRWLDPDCEWNPWGGSTGPDGSDSFPDVPQGDWPVIGSAPGYIAGFGALGPPPPPPAPGSNTLQAEGDEEIVIYLEPDPEVTEANHWSQYE